MLVVVVVGGDVVVVWGQAHAASVLLLLVFLAVGHLVIVVPLIFTQSDSCTVIPSLASCVRYSSYCANVARTYLVDPINEQEVQYAAVLEAQASAIAALVEGAPMSAAWDAVVSTLKVRTTSLGEELSGCNCWGLARPAS